MDVLTLVLIIGATGRTTRVGLKDDIAAPSVYGVQRLLARLRLQRVERFYIALMQCWWCLSYWVALAWALMGYHWGHMPTFQIVAAALTASWIVALIGVHLDPTQTSQPANNQVTNTKTS